MTPSLASGCLPGVTRQLVITLCSKLGISVLERDLEVVDVEKADEIFLTNSLREVQAAALLEAESSTIGATSSRIAIAYAAQVREELG